MIELKDLGLKPKDLLKIENWLKMWVEHFTIKAEGAKGTVERYDLENIDFFYFTDCRDVLSKTTESKGVEDNKTIRRRKRAVEYGLIFRKLLGEKLNKDRPCSHCGNGYRWINSLGDGTGHYVYCPKCYMTTVVTYPVGYETCIDRIKEDLEKNRDAIIHENKKVTGETLPLHLEVLIVCDTCGEKVKKSSCKFALNQCNRCYIDEERGESKLSDEKLVDVIYEKPFIVKVKENYLEIMYQQYLDEGGNLAYNDWLKEPNEHKDATRICDECGLEWTIKDNYSYDTYRCNECYHRVAAYRPQ